MSKIQIVWFRDLTRWDVGYYLGVKSVDSKFKLESLENILKPRKEKIKANEYDGVTPIVAKIPFEKSHIEYRKEPRTKMDMHAIYKDDLLVSNINFHQGAIALCDVQKCYASTHYQPYLVNRNIIIDKYLLLILKQKNFQKYVATKKTKGIKTESNYNFIKTLQIPLPPLKIQQEIVSKIQTIKDKIKALQEEEKRLKDEIEAYIYIALGLKKEEKKEKKKVFVVWFKDLERWDTTYNQDNGVAFVLSQGSSEATIKQSISQKVDCHENSYEFSRNDNSTSSSQSEAEAIHNNKTPKYPLVNLNDICLINPNVDFKDLMAKDKEVSFIPMEAVETNGVDFYPKIRKAKDYKGFTKFQNNDLLWAKITPCMQNKKSIVVKNLLNGYGFGSTEFFVIRPKDSNKVDINFILHFLRMDSVIKNAILQFKGSAGQRRVPKEFLQNLKIPLPPLKIQQEIVAFIKSKRKIIENNNALIQDLQNNLDKELENLIMG